MAQKLVERPEQSLPKQNQDWADLKGAYRLLNNSRVDPSSIGRTHQQLTLERAQAHPVVLCVQDDSDLSATKIESEQHQMHSSLAVLPDGQLLGMLDQHFFQKVKPPRNETRKQRAARWRESDVWQEAVERIEPPVSPCRLIHVADRGSDNLRFMHACVKRRVGFVVRAKSDRRVEEATSKLWTYLGARTIAGETTAWIGTQRNGLGRIVRRGREARLAVRFASVQLDQPWNCHETHDGPLRVNAVYLTELDTPPDVEPIDWMLLTSESVKNFEEAMTVIGYYRCRWVIEEWHRALKEGCRLERSQLSEPQALLRLTAMLSVVAVRLMQLRDAADPKPRVTDPIPRVTDVASEDANALKCLAPPIWIEVVAALNKIDANHLTVKQFWQTIARRGGWLARKHDPRPGWRAIWDGWRDVQRMVEGIELANANNITLTQRCG